MSTHGDDLDLLLSLQDRVQETPPSSPSPGYLSDDGSARQRGDADMSVFKSAVEDCLDYQHETSKKNHKSSHLKSSSDVDLEKFSGLRIRNQLVSRTELSDRFADIRFVRLATIKNLLSGETLSGCWATVGVLCETGEKRTSSTGKPYTIWQIGCLNEKTISVFLFGNAYQKNINEKSGAIFALFNCEARKNSKSKEGFSLTVFSAPQVLKIGTSADFGQCKSCTQFIDKRNAIGTQIVKMQNGWNDENQWDYISLLRKGIYCNYHKKNASEKYSSKRAEFMGGNLRTAFNFRDKMQSEGIYMVENPKNVSKPGQPMKVLSVEGLRKALSNAGKVTTNVYSQGIRFLSEVAGKPGSSLNQPIKSIDKRKSSVVGSIPPEVKTSQQLNAKRIKIEKGQTSAEKVRQGTEKMVELEILSSDDEF